MREFDISFEKIEIELDDKYIFFEKDKETHLFDFEFISFSSFLFKPKQKIFVNKIIITYKINKPENYYVFRNGFQSWSPSHFFKNVIKERSPFLKILKFHYLDPENFLQNISYIFTILKGGNAYLVFKDEDSIFYVYFIIEKRRVKVVFEIDKFLFEPTQLKIKIEEQEKLNFDQNFNKKIYGWTSWYFYYRNINKEEIFKNIESINNLPIKLDYFQIDDGWQISIGDWEENEKFKDSLKEICDRLNSKNISPGIWLAPFIVERNSSCFKERKDLLLRDKSGKIFPCGFNPLWSGYFYPLDIEIDEVREKILKILKNLKEIGFKLFKLDFLYAGFIKGERKNSRYDKFINFMNEIRKELNDSIILACGAPYILKDNLYDILRIGPDTMDGWKNSLLRLINFEGRVEAYNSLRNTIQRNIFSPQKFLFDPDVVFLKPKKLNLYEKETIIIINYLLSNVIFFSDPIYNLKKEDFNLIEKLKEIVNYYLIDFDFNEDLYKFLFKGEKFDFYLFVNLSDKVKRIENFKEEFIKKRDDNLIYPHESRIFLL